MKSFQPQGKNEIKEFIGKWMEQGIIILREIMKTYTTFSPTGRIKISIYVCIL